MSLSQVHKHTNECPGLSRQVETPLHGRWLLVARAVWIVVVVFTVGLFIISFAMYSPLLSHSNALLQSYLLHPDTSVSGYIAFGGHLGVHAGGYNTVIRGTHRALFAGFPPTGKQVIFRGTDFIRIADGKLIELWNCQQTLEFVLQLGAKLSFPEEANGTTTLFLKPIAEFAKKAILGRSGQLMVLVTDSSNSILSVVHFWQTCLSV